MRANGVGRAVVALREKKALSQAELAEKALIKPETLQRLENNVGKAHGSTVRKVAKALGLEPEQLHEYAIRLDQEGQPRAEQETRIEDDPLHRKLATATRLTAHRTNTVQADGDRPIVTLGGGLYVERAVEDEIVRLLSKDLLDEQLLVIEGEPGTGKSSLLWSVHKRLSADLGGDAWLLDAMELSQVFGETPGEDPTMSSEWRQFFQRLAGINRRPIILIDTVDASLSARSRSAYLIALLSELSAAGVIVAVASRPGEARQLEGFEPRFIRLYEYSEKEFPRAVELYSRAFVRDGAEVDSEEHAAQLLEAAAQGYPIREICRNPLTLRMLYSIYAPEQINVTEVDVISLYREYWARRVEADLRADREQRGAGADLSACAMQVAISMLVEGAPELPKAMLVRELEATGRDRSELDRLIGRGVLRVTELGHEALVTFFHQTFFEHAAAIAVLRLGGAAALRALSARWAETEGNLFVGSVLERALVLAEDEVHPIRKEAENVMLFVSGQGAEGTTVLVYVFVHRRAVPAEIAVLVKQQVEANDSLIVERLLGVGGNARRARRPELIGVFRSIIQIRTTRWLRRAMELLVRFASPDAELVGEALKSSGLGDVLLAEANRHPQARDIYIAFLGSYARHDPDWVFPELGRLLADAMRRRADETAHQIVEALASQSNPVPGAAARLETAAGLTGSGSADLKTHRDVAEEFGKLFVADWARQTVTAEHVIEDIDKAGLKGLMLTSRLNALVRLLLAATPTDVVAAFRKTSEVQDRTVRVMLGRITWAKLLPEMVDQWDAARRKLVLKGIRGMCGDILAEPRNAAAEILFHAIRYAHFRSKLVTEILERKQLGEQGPWLSTAVFGARLLDGVAAGIPGAQKAFAELVRSPKEYQKLGRAALVQLNNPSQAERALEFGMRLALQIADAEAILRLVESTTVEVPQWTVMAGDIRRVAQTLRGHGEVRSRRQAIRIEVALARLGLDPAIKLDFFKQHASKERDDDNQALLLQGLGYALARARGSEDDALSWLLAFGRGKGLKTRNAAMEVVEQICDRRPDVVVSLIDPLFDLVFEGKADGAIICRLEKPVFAVFTSDPARVPRLMDMLITKCDGLPMQTCRRVSGKFRRLFGQVVRYMDPGVRDRLLRSSPELNRCLGRMIIEGVTATGAPALRTKLKQIVEDRRSDPEIVGLATRLLRTESHVSGLEKWPELYELVRAA